MRVFLLIEFCLLLTNILNAQSLVQLPEFKYGGIGVSWNLAIVRSNNMELSELIEGTPSIAYLSVVIDEHGDLVKSFIQTENCSFNDVAIAMGNSLIKWYPAITERYKFSKCQLNIPVVFGDLEMVQFDSENQVVTALSHKDIPVFNYDGSLRETALPVNDGRIYIDYRRFLKIDEGVMVAFNLEPYIGTYSLVGTLKRLTLPGGTQGISGLALPTNGFYDNVPGEVEFIKGEKELVSKYIIDVYNDNWDHKCNPWCAYRRALIDLNKGSYSSAFEKFELARPGFPADPDLYFFMGLCQQGLDRPKKACKYYNMAAKFGDEQARIEADKICQLTE